MWTHFHEQCDGKDSASLPLCYPRTPPPTTHRVSWIPAQPWPGPSYPVKAVVLVTARRSAVQQLQLALLLQVFGLHLDVVVLPPLDGLWPQAPAQEANPGRNGGVGVRQGSLKGTCNVHENASSISWKLWGPGETRMSKKIVIQAYNLPKMTKLFVLGKKSNKVQNVGLFGRKHFPAKIEEWQKKMGKNSF